MLAFPSLIVRIGHSDSRRRQLPWSACTQINWQLKEPIYENPDHLELQPEYNYHSSLFIIYILIIYPNISMHADGSKNLFNSATRSTIYNLASDPTEEPCPSFPTPTDKPRHRRHG